MDIFSLFDLSGETALVTGGGQGLGKEMAIALAEAGADVAVVQRHIKRAEKVAEEIKKLGRNSIAIKGDVSKINDVENMIRVVMGEFGKLDILVNNAGVCYHVAAEEISKENWDEVININLTGVFLCSQIAGREMIKQRKGCIVNISSMSGLIVNRPQRQAHYSSSKAGVIMLTKSLAAEWAKYNIRVNTIAPGYMKTGPTAQDSKEMVEEYLYLTPMKRIADPSEIRGVVIFLASRAASFVTGSVIVMDGGYTVW